MVDDSGGAIMILDRHIRTQGPGGVVLACYYHLLTAIANDRLCSLRLNAFKLASVVQATFSIDTEWTWATLDRLATSKCKM